MVIMRMVLRPYDDDGSHITVIWALSWWQPQQMHLMGSDNDGSHSVMMNIMYICWWQAWQGHLLRPVLMLCDDGSYSVMMVFTGWWWQSHHSHFAFCWWHPQQGHLLRPVLQPGQKRRRIKTLDKRSLEGASHFQVSIIHNINHCFNCHHHSTRVEPHKSNLDQHQLSAPSSLPSLSYLIFIVILSYLYHIYLNFDQLWARRIISPPWPPWRGGWWSLQMPSWL